MLIKSPAFEDNGIIPRRHTGFGKDVSPGFILDELPDTAVSVAVIMDDLDVPFQKNFTHWIIWNIPPVNVIPEGLPGGKVIENPISAVQGKAWGKHVYRGPKQPPFIRKAHRYRFSVYALDIMLKISPDSDKAQLVKAMEGHIIEKSEITGIYDPT